jgi:mandelate racemase
MKHWHAAAGSTTKASSGSKSRSATTTIPAARGVPMSSHLYPEVSAHLLAATPTGHYLEYVDWLDPVVQEPQRIIDGHAVIPDRPGSGVVWDEKAVELYRL